MLKKIIEVIIDIVESLSKLFESGSTTRPEDSGESAQPVVSGEGDSDMESGNWGALVAAVKRSEKIPERIKPACIAMAILESGRGGSLVARRCLNFWGMHWRPEMKAYAEPRVVPEAASEAFCCFESIDDAVSGWRAWLDRSPYSGWDIRAYSSEAFLAFIGRIWCPPGYTQPWIESHGGKNYGEYVTGLLPEATKLLSGAAVPSVPATPVARPWIEIYRLDDGRPGIVVRNQYDRVIYSADISTVSELEDALGLFPDAQRIAVAPADEDLPTTPEEPTPVPAPEPEPERPSLDRTGAKLSWIPWAEDWRPRHATRGRYPQSHPEGAVVHYTAGRTIKGDMESGNKNGYCYLGIDRDGTVYQSHPLHSWGYHSGTSHHRKFVGIEIVCAGKLQKFNNEFYAWYDKARANPIPESQRRYVKRSGSRREEGWYMKYTDAQEKALVNLLFWLKNNAPNIFSFDNVVGHEEVSSQKIDPGGCLSWDMTDFRAYLKREYAAKVGIA